MTGRFTGSEHPAAWPPTCGFAILTLGSAMDWLMGLDNLSWSDPRAVFGWRFDVPAWAWAMIVLAAIALAVWSYNRLLGSRVVRFALAGLRAVILLVIALLLAGPMLVVTDMLIESDVLVMLVDRSASMRIEDGAAGESASRDDAVRAMLASHGGMFTDPQWQDRRQVRWFGFDESIAALDAGAATTGELSAPDGSETKIRTAIEQALRETSGQRVAGVVLMTDGRTAEATGGGLVRKLQQRGVGVFPVPIGAQRKLLDVSLAQVDAPQRAFVNDDVTLSAYISQFPREEELDPSRLTVRLIDPGSGEVLDERTGPDLRPGEPVRLTGRSELVGPVQWRVEVDYDTGDTAKEILSENNVSEVTIEIVDRPIRVLYVEGYPRWEYRYLQSMLRREESITSSMWLISADRSFAQEGDEPLTELPSDVEGFRPYDVIILGDIEADYLSFEQLSLIRDQVSADGAGLILIGGGAANPMTFDGTPLEAAMPMRSPGAVAPMQPLEAPIRVLPTRQAEALSVLQLRDPERSDVPPRQLWAESLPALRWVQELGPLKSTAELLAEGRMGEAGPTVPILVRMRYGNGQVLYLATDETWRWRYGRGELFFEQFWTQLVRMLGRARLQSGQRRAALVLADRRVQTEQPTVVELKIDDPVLLERDLARVEVTVEPIAGEGGTSTESLELLPMPASDDGAAARGVRYRALWTPRQAGRFELRVTEPGLDDLELRQELEVISRSDEWRQPLPDHERLERLAEMTGGAVIEPADFGRLPDIVPDRSVETPDPKRESLWDSPLSLIVVLVLLTVEWVARKWIRLA